jgi:hypothetical protein
LESKGLTKSKVKKMTIKEKILAMKGVTLGAATVGGAPAQVARYMFRLYGVKPDVDVQFVAVGFGARGGILPRTTCRALDLSSGRRVPQGRTTERPARATFGVHALLFGTD